MPLYNPIRTSAVSLVSHEWEVEGEITLTVTRRQKKNLSKRRFKPFSMKKSLSSVRNLSEGILSYVVMVDSVDVESLVHTKKMLEFFEPVDVPFVVAANKQDMQGALDVTEIRKRLHLTDGVQVLPCVASQRERVKQVLLTLLFEVLELLEE